MLHTSPEAEQDPISKDILFLWYVNCFGYITLIVLRCIIINHGLN